MRSPLSGGEKAQVAKKENIGLVLGALLFVASILFPIPPSMAKVAPDNNSLPAFAPQLALGTMLWIVVCGGPQSQSESHWALRA
jgi:hypothetical protein